MFTIKLENDLINFVIYHQQFSFLILYYHLQNNFEIIIEAFGLSEDLIQFNHFLLIFHIFQIKVGIYIGKVYILSESLHIENLEN